MLREYCQPYESTEVGAVPSSNFITIALETDGDSRSERTLVIDVKDGKLFAEVYDSDHDRVGSADVFRPDARSVSVVFSRKLLGQNVKEYRWKAATFFHAQGDGPCGIPSDVFKTCTDIAPNRGLLVHRL
jgi:hypothetical protein